MNQEINHDDTTTRTAEYASGKGDIVLRPHIYDGIQEYDQKLPNWWLFTLWAAIVLFIGYYLVVYTFGIAQTDVEIMNGKIAKIEAVKSEATQGVLAKLNDEVFVNEWSTNEAKVAAGEKTYMASCVACHAADLAAHGGAAARPLNDGIWEYGSTPMDVMKMVTEGTPKDAKGYKGGIKMAPMGSANLTTQQVAEITAFLISKNPKDFAKFKK